MEAEPIRPIFLGRKISKAEHYCQTPSPAGKQKGIQLRIWNKRNWELLDVNYWSSWDRRNFNSLFSPDVQPLTMAEKGGFSLPEPNWLLSYNIGGGGGNIQRAVVV